jgi:hypothetical protein
MILRSFLVMATSAHHSPRVDMSKAKTSGEKVFKAIVRVTNKINGLQHLLLPNVA